MEMSSHVVVMLLWAGFVHHSTDSKLKSIGILYRAGY